MNPEYLSFVANHLWQLTLFGGLAGLLTLALRNNHARVRHGVWLVASCKFLIPFAALVAMGNQIRWQPAQDTARFNWPVVMEEVGQPFRMPAVSSPSPGNASHEGSPLPEIVFGIWAAGFFGISCSWWIRWRRMKGVVFAGAPVAVEIPIRAVCSRESLEPGVFGIFRPILLLPEGIFEQLAPAQLQAVIEHELCHVRRRDNLIAALHMFVESVFWFHPLVWWIGKRMMEERERACDEEVLRLGSEPRVYAEGILNVCKSYVESPLACASSVTGSDLKKRIAAIVTNRPALELDMRRRVLLMGAGAAAVIGPVGAGMLGALPTFAQTGAGIETPAFEAASVKVHQDTGQRDRARSIEADRIRVVDASLGEFISFAYDIKRYQISGPDWILNNSVTYNVDATAGRAASLSEMRRMLQALLAERFHLVLHRETRELPIFALLVARGAPKFDGPGDGAESSVRPDGEGGLSFNNYSMDAFAEWLTGLPSMGRPVIDQTGLAGRFSFHANFFELGRGAPPEGLKRAMGSDDAADMLRAALPEQLGLKLEGQKAPLETLVIDRAEKIPTEN